MHTAWSRYFTVDDGFRTAVSAERMVGGPAYGCTRYLRAEKARTLSLSVPAEVRKETIPREGKLRLCPRSVSAPGYLLWRSGFERALFARAVLLLCTRPRRHHMHAFLKNGESSKILITISHSLGCQQSLRNPSAPKLCPLVTRPDWLAFISFVVSPLIVSLSQSYAAVLRHKNSSVRRERNRKDIRPSALTQWVGIFSSRPLEDRLPDPPPTSSRH